MTDAKRREWLDAHRRRLMDEYRSVLATNPACRDELNGLMAQVAVAEVCLDWLRVKAAAAVAGEDAR